MSGDLQNLRVLCQLLEDLALLQQVLKGNSYEDWECFNFKSIDYPSHPLVVVVCLVVLWRLVVDVPLERVGSVKENLRGRNINGWFYYISGLSLASLLTIKRFNLWIPAKHFCLMCLFIQFVCMLL